SELFVRISREESSAWEELDSRYRRWLIDTVRRVARDRNWFWASEPEDMAQESLELFGIRVREGRFRFQSEPQLRAYLLKTMFFIAMRQKRSARLQVRPLAPGEGDTFAGELPAVDWVS